MNHSIDKINFFRWNFLMIQHILVIVCVIIACFCICNINVTIVIKLASLTLSILLVFGISINLSYPIVHNDYLEIVWFILPFIRKKYLFNDIDHIEFNSFRVSKSEYYIRIMRKDLTANNYYNLVCMPYQEITRFIKALESYGVTVKDKYNS